MQKQFNKHIINIIDTPGHVDFTVEVERSLKVLDGSIIVFCASSGVEPQSETVWRQANKYQVPKIVFINKMDRAGANYLKVLEQINTRFGVNVYPVQMNVGKEDFFRGVIDIVEESFIVWDDKNSGLTYNISKQIPLDLKESTLFYRQKLIECAIETSESLMSSYISNVSIDINDLYKNLRNRTIRNEIVLSLCGSAFKNKGIQPLLDAIVYFLPSPLDVKAIHGKGITSKQSVRFASNTEYFSSLVFKLTTDPFVGNLYFLRVYSGILKVGDFVYNSVKLKKERISRLVRIHANKKEEVRFVQAGDIAACIGLKHSFTGDTLCSFDNPIILEKMSFPQPVISVSISPVLKNNQEKMAIALSKLSMEDPSLKVSVDKSSSQTLISGMGELHLDIIIDRMKREFNVNVLSGKPQVSYRESIKLIVTSESKFVRQSGGRGQYAHVVLRLEPLLLGQGVEFVNKIVGGTIPKDFIPAVKKGVLTQLQEGVLLGYPLVDIRVVLYDGSYHDVDSSEIAFMAASSLAIKKGIKNANPFLLEPVMNISINSPQIYVGDIIGDINSRRGIIFNIKEEAAYCIITAFIPLAEIFGYATSIRSLSQGRAYFSMKFEKYSEVPSNIVSKLTSKKLK
ncbi:UNVERIFIED_CONTAM: hypothetical protein GTU68_026389 [Idotea baltica]|nr:hypothetical protein [Idotea baltica]